jgi:hypothetical protein
MKQLDVSPARPIHCLDCNQTTLFEGAKPAGWIAETWKTIGDGNIRVVMCFQCRNLTDWSLYRTEQMIGAWL